MTFWDKAARPFRAFWNWKPIFAIRNLAREVSTASWLRFAWGTLLWLLLTFAYVLPRLEAVREDPPTGVDLLFVLVWVALPLMPLFAEVEILGLRFKHRDEKSVADKHYEAPSPPAEGERIVKFGKQESEAGLPVRPGRTCLSLKARIFYPSPAGYNALMLVRVNGVVLGKDRLLNKGPTKKLGDGRTADWFDPQSYAWRIPFSPDFKANYSHDSYRVLNGDPYLFVFDLAGIEPDDKGRYNAVVEHIAKTGNDAFRNDIFLREITTV